MKPWPAPAPPPGRATPCCSRRRARATTCSATTRTAARFSRRRCAPWRRDASVFYADARPRSQLPEYDLGLMWTAVLLLGLGLVMVYSASIAIAEGSRATGYQPHYFLLRQSLFVVAGLVAGAVAFQMPLRWWQRAAPWLFLIGAGLLVLVLVPGIGREVNGSRRWLALQVITVQPSEFMKLFAVLYAADYTVRKAAHMASFRKGFLPM